MADTISHTALEDAFLSPAKNPNVMAVGGELPPQHGDVLVGRSVTIDRLTDKFPTGALMEKGLSVKSGQTHAQKYMPKLLEMIIDGKLDTTFLISHRMSLEDAPQGYRMFHEEKDRVTKVVLKPTGLHH